MSKSISLRQFIKSYNFNDFDSFQEKDTLEYWDSECYYCGFDVGEEYYCEQTGQWLTKYIDGSILNDEIEIIEETPEKIEPLKLISFPKFKDMCPAERYVITAKEYDKLEELRLAVNYLLEKENE